MLNHDFDLNHSAGDTGVFCKLTYPIKMSNIVIVQPPPMDDGNDNSVCPSPLPDRVVHPKPHGKAPVPKLDLTGAKTIQQNIANKLNQAAQQNHAPQEQKYLDKIKQ